jgi:hypothetical protein
MGQHGARHADHAEKVRVENRLRLFDRAFFGPRRSHPEARIIDQQIDASFLRDHRRDGGLHRSVACHIEASISYPLWPVGATAAATVDLEASL